MAGNATRDMTEGSPMKLILGFSIPLLFGALFQQFYSVVDTVIVGQFLGVKALAGVGATGSVNFMVVGFCMGICSGFAIPVSHKFGAKDYSGMRRFVANSVWLSVGFAAVITLLVSLLCRNILTWMNTPEDIFEEAYIYILIIFIGIPATFLYNILSGIIRSMGDSRTPLMFLVISSLLNIGLDLLCIVVFRMGVAGAAAATVVSQLISGLLCLWYMIRRYEILHITKEEWKADPHQMKLLCSMGVPMGLQYSITAIGSVFMQPPEMGSTMATYGGQNVGAKRLDRLGRGLFACSVLGVGYSLCAFAAMYFFGTNFAQLFVSASEIEILNNARQMLIINSAFYVPLAFVKIIRFMIQGMGYSTFAILAGVFEMVARTLAGLILVPQLGFLGACFSNPMAWVAADLFLIPAYIHVRRKLNRQFGQEASATFFNPLAYLLSCHRLRYRLPLLPHRKAE